MNNMFCFQCEQTSGCTGCTGNAGVCGKKNDIALLQDKLTGALIGLARCTDAQNVKLSDRAARVMIEGLFATLTNVNFDENALTLLYNAVQEEKKKQREIIWRNCQKQTTQEKGFCWLRIMS